MYTLLKKDKSLIFAFTDMNNEILETYTELWNEIKNQIETMNDDKPVRYKRVFMKIRLESDEDLSFFLHECLYEFVEKLKK